MNFFAELINSNPFHLFKNKTIRKNIGNSFFYFGGTLLNFIIAVFTQPIYSKYLELQDFAVIGYFTAIQALLAPLFNMSLQFYYLAMYWRRDEGINSKENLNFVLNFLNISNAIIVVISFLFLNIYFEVAEVKFPLFPFILIVFANLFFNKYKVFFLIECRIKKQGLRFLLANVLQIITNTAFSLYFVIMIKGGAVGYMSGALIGIIMVSIAALFLFKKENIYNLSFSINKSKIKSALKYSIPLIIGAYAYFPIGNMDRLYLERLGNIGEYGYYTIGLQIAGFAGTFFLVLYQSFEPDLYKLIVQKRYKQYLLFIIFYAVLLIVFCSLFIIFSEPVISFLTSGRYTYASKYANIFVIGLVIMRIGGFFEQIFTAFGATKFVMWHNVIMGVFCIIAYYFMIQHYQFYGANITRVIAALFYVIVGGVMFILFLKNKKGKNIKYQ